MVSCRLCGYQGRDASSQCPVCGEAYDSPQGVRVPGPRLAQAGGGLWCGGSQQDSRFGVVGEFDIAEAAKASTHHLNLDLQSLLRLIPEQQDRRKRAQRDVVWATEAGLAPDQANGGRRDPDVVYIQPRVDPTMTVLKGRYNTQPRMAKATSMSVLNRLAHPLMGYDSIGALAPKARKRRQESVERLLGQATAGGESKGDGQARQLNKSHSAMHLSGPPAKNTLLRSRSSRSRIAPRAPMAVSVNAVHLHGRKTSVGSGGPQHRRHHRRVSRARPPQTSEAAAASPLLRSRASGGRRAKPNLRQKRVATMRSVGGWVRRADPASARRQDSLDRQMVALRKTGNQILRDKRKDGSRTTCNSNRVKRQSNSNSGGTFLTELEETDAGPSQGNGGFGSWINGCDAPRRRSSVKAKTARKHPQVRGQGSSSATAQRQQARRRSSGVGRGPSSTESRARRATVLASIPGRSRSEGTRGKVRLGRTKSVEELDPYGEHRRRPGRIDQSSARGEARERGQEDHAGKASVSAPPRPPPPELSGELGEGRVVAGNSANWIPSHPDGAWISPSPARTTGYGADISTGSAGLEWKSSTAKGTDTHETDITMAPAWGVLGSYEASPLPEDAGARFRAWQGREPGASTRPCSEWQLLRSGGVHSLSRSAELLRSFENKVGSPLSADEPQPRRPASAAPAAVSKDEGTAWQHQQQQQQQQQQPLLPEGDHDGGRQRHHRQLPLPREQQQQQQQQRGGTPPSPSKSRSLASMHNRPGSSSWVHRRSLPSLLNHGATEGPTRTRRAKASSTPPTEPPGGPTARRRGKRRTPLEEPIGRMQRLDMTSVAVTVGDALSRSGLSLRCGGGENRGWKSPRAEAASARSFVGEREAGAATPPHGELEGGLSDGRANGVGSFGRGMVSNGKLLSSAVPKPLLYVGSGGGFRFRS